jgi:hypothetical protein
MALDTGHDHTPNFHGLAIFGCDVGKGGSGRLPVGVVHRIHFIGNLGVDSQIDTVVRSLLVRGVTRFQKGSVLEQRKTLWNLKICEAGTTYCEVRLGYR